MRARCSGVLIAACLLLLPLAGAHGGSYSPPPGDASPQWSPDGRHIAFLTKREPRGVRVVNADGTGERQAIHADVWAYAVSPDWRRVAFVAFSRATGRYELRVAALDRAGELKVADVLPGSPPAWSPDSSRIAFSTRGELAVASADGSAVRTLAARGLAPSWSPDGTRIAFVARPVEADPSLDIFVVGQEGGAPVNVTRSGGSIGAPSWSPDGSWIAFYDGLRIGLVRPDGSAKRSLTGPNVTNPGLLTWSPGGRELAYSIPGRGLFRVDIASAKTRRISGVSAWTLAWAPAGGRIALSAGAECRDRVGIYVADVDGSPRRRITNDCRVLGTSRDDRLRGTALADVILGRAGNDRLEAHAPGYVGDTLDGGTGNDVLLGSGRSDTLRGGTGADTLEGGGYGDELDAGAGPDNVHGDGGKDRVSARDGARDRIGCGPGPDTAVVDRSDSVAGDCETVLRPRR